MPHQASERGEVVDIISQQLIEVPDSWRERSDATARSDEPGKRDNIKILDDYLVDWRNRKEVQERRRHLDIFGTLKTAMADR